MRRVFAYLLLVVVFLTGCSSPILGSGEAVLPKPVEAPAISAPQMGNGSGAVVPPVYALPQDHPLPRAEEIGKESGQFGDPMEDGPCKGFPKGKVESRDQKQVESMRFIKREVLDPNGRLANYPLWGTREAQNSALQSIDLTKMEFVHPVSGIRITKLLDLKFLLAFGPQQANEIFGVAPKGGSCHLWPKGTEKEMYDIEKQIWNLLSNIT